MHILSSWVYHSWKGRTRFFIIKVHLFPTALANTFSIRANCEKALWNASAIHTCGSGCQLLYLGIWPHNLDINRFTSTDLKSCISFWKIVLFKIHSFDEFLVHLKLFSDLIFKAAGRYSAISIFPLVKKVSHIFLASWILIRTLAAPRILLNKGILLDCSFAHGLVDLFCIWKLSLLKTLLP